MNIERKSAVELASVGLTQACPNYTAPEHNMSATMQSNQQKEKGSYHPAKVTCTSVAVSITKNHGYNRSILA